MVIHSTDEQLVHLLKVGDVEAFNEIYARYWKLLLYIAGKRLDNIAEAEEAVQNIFTDLWARRSSLEIKRSLKYYLAAAVQYQVMSILGRNARLVKMEEAGENPSALWADQRLHFQQLEEQLQQIVQALPERCRLVYQLSREEGLSNKAIAAHLGISEKTVENQLTKALARLRAGLGDKAYLLLLILATNDSL